MKYILIRKIFRISLLVTLLFRILFREKMAYRLDVISYIILAIALAGMIVLEIIVYIQKRKKES